MSQHVFAAEDGQIVLAGYDRQCGEYYFTIFANNNVEEPTAESGEGLREISQLRKELDALVSGVPGTMYESIRQDAIDNVGNRMVRWKLDGSIEIDSAAQGRMAA
ncbi:hypothetical protein os4_36990 (plasmid) [Comamonadaceae bacterium OS-4]|nr:hypothetical protein os4_36990 [Comamonadaceae bacterium OS-4]